MGKVRTVDVSSWTTAGDDDETAHARRRRAECCEEFGAALRELGMVVIVGHGIRSETIGECSVRSRDWFEATAPGEKRACTRGPYGCEEGGYTAMGVEAVAAATGEEEAAVPDAIESFVFRGRPGSFPVRQLPPGFRAAADDYYARLEELLGVLHRIACASLGVDPDHFYEEGIFSRDREANRHTLKLSYYPPVPGGSGLRYGAHTDFQDTTILRPDPSDWTVVGGAPDNDEDEDPMVASTGGLQVYDPSVGRWEPVVVHDPDALCVNLGDFWRIWSHGHYPSPLHRVTHEGVPAPRSILRPAATTGRSAARCSMVFFSVPFADARIAPLPGVPPAEGYDDEGETGGILTAGEHLDLKLARINS